MRRYAVALWLVGSLCGCGGPMVWDKPDATQADLRMDAYGCEKDARQSGYFGGGLAGALNMREFFKKCMMAHGYVLRGGSPILDTNDIVPVAAPVVPATITCHLGDGSSVSVLATETQWCQARGGTVDKGI